LFQNTIPNPLGFLPDSTVVSAILLYCDIHLVSTSSQITHCTNSNMLTTVSQCHNRDKLVRNLKRGLSYVHCDIGLTFIDYQLDQNVINLNEKTTGQCIGDLDAVCTFSNPISIGDLFSHLNILTNDGATVIEAHTKLFLEITTSNILKTSCGPKSRLVQMLDFHKCIVHDMTDIPVTLFNPETDNACVIVVYNGCDSSAVNTAIRAYRAANPGINCYAVWVEKDCVTSFPGIFETKIRYARRSARRQPMESVAAMLELTEKEAMIAGDLSFLPALV